MIFFFILSPVHTVYALIHSWGCGWMNRVSGSDPWLVSTKNISLQTCPADLSILYTVVQYKYIVVKVSYKHLPDVDKLNSRVLLYLKRDVPVNRTQQAHLSHMAHQLFLALSWGAWVSATVWVWVCRVNNYAWYMNARDVNNCVEQVRRIPTV